MLKTAQNTTTHTMTTEDDGIDLVVEISQAEYPTIDEVEGVLYDTRETEVTITHNDQTISVEGEVWGLGSWHGGRWNTTPDANPAENIEMDIASRLTGFVDDERIVDVAHFVHDALMEHVPTVEEPQELDIVEQAYLHGSDRSVVDNRTFRWLGRTHVVIEDAAYNPADPRELAEIHRNLIEWFDECVRFVENQD